MSVFSLLYVSQNVISKSVTAAEVKQIVALAKVRNAMLGVTGALLSTGSWFAQVLEGDLSAVDELMSSIKRDRRHASLVIVHTDFILHRRFAGLSMACSGTIEYGGRPVSHSIRDTVSGVSSPGAHKLIAFMQNSARGF